MDGCGVSSAACGGAAASDLCGECAAECDSLLADRCANADRRGGGGGNRTVAGAPAYGVEPACHRGMYSGAAQPVLEWNLCGGLAQWIGAWVWNRADSQDDLDDCGDRRGAGRCGVDRTGVGK